MVVHSGNELQLPVLTNSTYEQSALNDSKGTAGLDNSLQRFSTACKMLRSYITTGPESSLVDYSFEILDQVSQGDFTKWSIVYDITAKKINFKTNQYRQVRSVNFSSFDFSCLKSSRIVDVNRPEPGNMDSFFEDFSNQFNQAVVEKTIVQSSPRITITASEKQAIIGYPRTISCK
jgi:choloylglycine hydrolase